MVGQQDPNELALGERQLYYCAYSADGLPQPGNLERDALLEGDL